jgi:hypothetical protein
LLRKKPPSISGPRFTGAVIGGGMSWRVDGALDGRRRFERLIVDSWAASISLPGTDGGGLVLRRDRGANARLAPRLRRDGEVGFAIDGANQRPQHISRFI